VGGAAGGIVLLLIAVYLLLAYFDGRLEWLFTLDKRADATGGGFDDIVVPFPLRPTSVGR
jgi:hypothetical protein